MSNSLKDQLLALGLAPKKAAQKPRQHTRPNAAKKQAQASQKRKKPQDSSEISLDQAYRIRVREERSEKERAIAIKREKERQRREVNRKIKEMVAGSGVRDPEADCKRNFVYKGRIRSVLATRKQIAAINSGELGVVYLSGNYHLMPAKEIEEIRKFAADHIPELGGAEIEGEEDNPVPDDLIW